MLAEVLVTVKELSREVHFLKNELADIKTTLGESQGQPDLAPANKLPMQSMEDFNEVQTSLKSDVSVRQKMIARLASVGGTSSEAMIRRMLGSSISNSLACDFNWAGKGTKQAFSQTIIQDCMFAAARRYDKKNSHLDFSNTVKRWLRYAPERVGGVRRTPTSPVEI
ncbi:unnamed protein product [Gadus morhua 'NCC']